MKENQQTKQRDSFNSRFGFVLACIGSAVGMGNIWLFPYRVGQYGGAAFLIPYFLFIFIIGLSGVIGEMAFGRAMGTGPLGAFGKASRMRGGNWGGMDWHHTSSRLFRHWHRIFRCSRLDFKIFGRLFYRLRSYR